MSTQAFESRQARLASAIDEAVEQLRTAQPMALPSRDAPLVGHCVERIGGDYDVSRAKHDTDHATDLLYIAYNTTPKKHGEIRIQIGDIMNKLVKAQQESARTMTKALGAAREINLELANLFPVWVDIRKPIAAGEATAEQIAELRSFATKELSGMAKFIQDKATSVQRGLEQTAKYYDAIILETERVTARSELALSKVVTDREALQRQIVESNAQREKLEMLVTDLRTEVEKFDRLARDFEQRANSAEERSFAMSIVRAATSMLSVVIPPLAMLAAGSGLLGSAARGSSAGGAAAGDDADPEAGAQAKRDLADKQSERKALLDESGTLDKEITGLRADLEKEEAPTAQEALKARIAKRDEQREKQQARMKGIDGEIAALQAAMDVAGKEAGRISDEQQEQATSLREMQMKMIDKSEAYEKERRTQAGELVRISALLKGEQNEKEEMDLAVKSLELSIGALKRMKEIVQEMAFFFKSFADFMATVAGDAARQLVLFEKAETGTLRENALRNLVRSTDAFFLKQAAEWFAASQVSGLFVQCFDEGWTKLNKLSGTYLTGEALTTYLGEAGARLIAISKEREQAAEARIVDLQGYREELQRAAA